MGVRSGGGRGLVLVSALLTHPPTSLDSSDFIRMPLGAFLLIFLLFLLLCLLYLHPLFLLLRLFFLVLPLLPLMWFQLGTKLYIEEKKKTRRKCSWVTD